MSAPVRVALLALLALPLVAGRIATRSPVASRLRHPSIVRCFGLIITETLIALPVELMSRDLHSAIVPGVGMAQAGAAPAVLSGAIHLALGVLGCLFVQTNKQGEHTLGKSCERGSDRQPADLGLNLALAWGQL